MTDPQATTRWQFTDPATSETYVLPINPDSMTSPLPQKSYQFAPGGDGTAVGVLAPPTPVDWQFGGPIRTQAHNDALDAWSQRPGKVHITDHLGRTFEVMIYSYEPTERQPTRRTTWRLRYVMKASILRQV